MELSEKLNLFKKCLPKKSFEEESIRGFTHITFNNPLLKSWYDVCVKQASLSSGIEIEEKKESIYDQTKDIEYSNAFIYVFNRNDLDEVIKLIESIHELNFDEKYKDTLNRFSALSEFLNIFVPIIGITFGSLFFSILWINISSFISHRRHSYGIFLAKGLNNKQIHFILSGQVFIFSFFGYVISFALFEAFKSYFDSKIPELEEKYKEIITWENKNFLPLTDEFLIVFIVGLLVILFLTNFLLWFKGVRKNTTPDELFDAG
jgi:ABC-type antimicrobial peptide transport system permease subunit